MSMKKLFILQGPPCSGKSTWSKDYKDTVDNDVVIGNRDTIRYEIGNGKYDQDHESEVTRIETERVENGMKEGKTVILDDTNLNPKYLQPWYDMAEKYGYEVETKEFYVPFKEAMRRSKERKANGGLYINKDVMTRFYKRYYKDRLEEELRDYRLKQPMKGTDKSLPHCIICDLDGTIAMHNGRTPFEWDRLQEDIIDERLSIILNVFGALQSLSLGFLQSEVEIIFLTGRPDNVRKETEEWLDTNYQGKYTLIMRDSRDYSPGQECKKKLYEKYIDSKYNVLCVFDDSNKCVEMWRSLGLLTLQVQNGDY